MNDQLFSHMDNERLYKKIVLKIKKLVQEDDLKAGDRLPGERDLAVRFECSRSTIREAFRVLESERIIVSRPGEGRFIKNVNQHLGVEKYASSRDYIEKKTIIFFLEAREALEPKIAELACPKAEEEDIEILESILLKMEEKLKNPLEKAADDSIFHLALAKATQNFVFVSMMKTNLNIFHHIRKKTLLSKKRTMQSLGEHRAILEAVKYRSVSDAVDLTVKHLQNLRKNVLENY
ncbi:FadR/GntR family transcriptional regulator [Bacillus taeanensis]|uniref:HTH gntR-type domain-containing protein n=1 Tax=Bacillus taeanensis TaxID=273032 RepID=A0A366XXQ9_9BACI|nr:FCD domain-containing protein [Bacillus taeanensis]RBW70687.1 hypothetical protein DS031_04170 [Bacillus taeanensis]